MATAINEGYGHGTHRPSYTGEVGFNTIDSEAERTRALMDAYFALREDAASEHLPKASTIRKIQAEVGADVGLNLREQLAPANRPYGRYEPDAVTRFQAVIDYLREHHGKTIPRCVFDASEAFLEMAVGMYEATPAGNTILEGTDGAFGFLVPPRADEEHPGYSHETIEACPILRYVPDDLRIHMYVGMPPFVVDRYDVDEYGNRGYMILVPAFADMKHLGRNEALRRSWIMANEAVRMGRRLLGIEIFGLGASLPAVTHYGDVIREEGAVTTTGHGGTIALVTDSILRLHESNILSDDDLQNIGFLGAGTIGASIAQVISKRFPEAAINIYDPDRARSSKAVSAIASARQPGNGTVTDADNARTVLANSKLIISAATSPVDLTGITSLEGVTIIDDSQPGAFDKAQVEALGGRLLWVVGENPGGAVIRRSSGWNYGGTLMPDGLFGCESEAAALYTLYQQLLHDPSFQSAYDAYNDEPVRPIDIIREQALRQGVTPDDAERFYRLFQMYGIRATSTPQAEGRPTQLRSYARKNRVARISDHRRWRWGGKLKPLLESAGAIIF